ncbi:MAG: M23 family metallopeptidase [Candidatus Riflebacteria bacterium]|nr:M23 family metallopeptidase [Candidatus Riflebacteria bacterium]
MRKINLFQEYSRRYEIALVFTLIAFLSSSISLLARSPYAEDSRVQIKINGAAGYPQSPSYGNDIIRETPTVIQINAGSGSPVPLIMIQGNFSDIQIVTQVPQNFEEKRQSGQQSLDGLTALQSEINILIRTSAPVQVNININASSTLSSPSITVSPDQEVPVETQTQPAPSNEQSLRETFQQLKAAISGKKLEEAAKLLEQVTSPILNNSYYTAVFSNELGQVKDLYQKALENEIRYGSTRLLSKLESGQTTASIIDTMLWTKKWMDALKKVSQNENSPALRLGNNAFYQCLWNQITYGTQKVLARKNAGETWEQAKASVAWTQTWIDLAVRVGIGQGEAWFENAKKVLNETWPRPVTPPAPPVVNPPASGRTWQHPCPEGVASPYSGDDGCDFHATRGTSVYSSRDGWIVYNDPSGHSRQETSSDDTGAIRIRHSDGKHTWYAHMSGRETQYTAGEFVPAGTKIGRVGIANSVSHLHFSIFYSAGGDAGGFMGPFEIANMFRNR